VVKKNKIVLFKMINNLYVFFVLRDFFGIKKANPVFKIQICVFCNYKKMSVKFVKTERIIKMEYVLKSK